MSQPITAAHAADKKQVWFAARAAADKKSEVKHEQFTVDDLKVKPPSQTFLNGIQAASLTLDVEKDGKRLKITLHGVRNDGLKTATVLGFATFR
jgi:hypothetical protein